MNYSWYAPFLKAGIEVWPVFDGTSMCCQANFGNGAGSSCNMLAGKEALAQELLGLALKYNLTGFQQDWEFDDAWNWRGCECSPRLIGPARLRLHPVLLADNESMTYIASVLNAHGVRLGNSIDSHQACEFDEPGADRTTAMCAPAYHHSPWAAILTGTSALRGARSSSRSAEPVATNPQTWAATTPSHAAACRPTPTAGQSESNRPCGIA